MNYGLLLTDIINNKNDIYDKKKLLMIIEKYKIKIKNEQDEKNEKIKNYYSNYEKKRNENEEKYKNYYINYVKLKDNWINSKKEIDLEKLKNIKKPELIDIDDIYTYMIIKNKNLKN